MVPGSRVLLWCNMRQNSNGQPTVAAPAPVDAATPDAPWWYDFIAGMAPELAAAGVTDVLFPNPVIGQGAPGPGDDGYNPENDYSIGGNGTPTRFGNREQFLRAVAICHAHGINVLLDHVMHQRMGGKNGFYTYKSATGAINGRFPKHPSCFRVNSAYAGGVAEDPVPVPSDDFAFGDELCPVNAQPPKYVWNGLLDAAEWLFNTSGAGGARLDDMKGIAVEFMNAFFDADFAQGKFWFGEYDDGNVDNLDWWVNQVGGRCSVTDFAFQENMAYPMCMQAGGNTGWRMSWMQGNGYIAKNPMKAVPFVSSMDSETDGWATIVNNKKLGLALLFGGEGLPLGYIRDYLPQPLGYGLGAPMRNMMWVARCLANGSTDVVYADAKSYVFKRTGSPGLLVALNNDIWSPDWTTVTCRSGFSTGTVLHDYSGKNGQDCRVDGFGNVTFGIPPAANGEGYGFWAPAGLDQSITYAPRYTSQVIYGATDLDIPPLPSTGTFTIARVWAASGTVLTATLTPDATGWGNSVEIDLTVSGPDGKALGTLSFDDQGEASQAVAVPVGISGWQTMTAVCSGLPDGGSGFALRVHYLGAALAA